MLPAATRCRRTESDGSPWDVHLRRGRERQHHPARSQAQVRGTGQGRSHQGCFRRTHHLGCHRLEHRDERRILDLIFLGEYRGHGQRRMAGGHTAYPHQDCLCARPPAVHGRSLGQGARNHPDTDRPAVEHSPRRQRTEERNRRVHGRRTRVREIPLARRRIRRHLPHYRRRRDGMSAALQEERHRPQPHPA